MGYEQQGVEQQYRILVRGRREKARVNACRHERHYGRQPVNWRDAGDSVRQELQGAPVRPGGERKHQKTAQYKENIDAYIAETKSMITRFEDVVQKHTYRRESPKVLQ
jgi:hypothetical protein